METTKIKVKIGSHEFEAEGPVEIVKDQFEAFKNIIASSPATTVQQLPVASQQPNVINTVTTDEFTVALGKIVRVDGRVVSLTARPSSTEEFALIILLGQKTFRTNEAVTGSELMDGLELSGVKVARVDRLMEKLSSEGMVIKIGMGKGTRYRLTNSGAAKAMNTAKELIAVVA